MRVSIILIVVVFLSVVYEVTASEVRIKDLGRVEQDRNYSLVGYGLVMGLGGTGDSQRNKVTLQSLRNTLRHFDIEVSENDITSRNVAAVMLTADLSSYAEVGGSFDISVASIGDAKSLTGGELMLTPLKGLDEKIYGFAKGTVTTGGYRVESLGNVTKKNHTTSGRIVRGGVLERSLMGGIVTGEQINIYLNEPDYTTATRMVEAINSSGLVDNAVAKHPGKVVVDISESQDAVIAISQIEVLKMVPDMEARVVVNEKTGTIVSGGNVLLSAVNISHGNLQIEIQTEYLASQPSGIVTSGTNGIASLVIPNSQIKVEEGHNKPVSIGDGTEVSDLVTLLNDIGLSTRDIITILQSIKSAGALHADLIIK